MGKTIIAFDLYGTILSTSSIAAHLESLYGKEKAAVIAAQARIYQLEYTWRINSMQGDSHSRQPYHNFSEVTRWSFRHATKEAGVAMTQAEEDGILNAYNGLDTFEDATKGLQIVASSDGLDAYIFSNGTPDMLAASLSSSPGLAKANASFPPSKIISVDDITVFKPDPRVYRYLQTKAQQAGGDDSADIWLVSSNPFDVVGAVAAGLKAAWVGRGNEWLDGLGNGAGYNPTIIVKGVDEAVEEIRRRSS
ncbi:hypothetical protein VHEMI07526 [[Torrubiella] hemipterigena]|uniref:Haloacid dehalogenase n=1 Tax=[Torrubiella] hemipterigena TaxID=1531966 RepID=A0A0A1TLU5_9HYPO|nr:hypothetical protein VHEMI07526 [[Torrubiella] hemipterigena]